MAVSTIAKPKSVSAFPKAAVEAVLRKELLDYVVTLAPLKEITLPTAVAAKMTFKFQIDSLGVVDLLCAVEPLLGFKLKDSVVRAGGYGSIEEAMAHVMPRIEKAWDKKHV
jgi:acyl carrier protein